MWQGSIPPATISGTTWPCSTPPCGPICSIRRIRSIRTRYGAEASVKNAILADGCNIQGAVEDSVLFRGVTVGRGSVVKNSIIMQGVTIGDGCSLDHVVLDKGVTIRDGRTLIGYDSFPIILKKNTTV